MPERASILLIEDEARLRHNLQVLLEEDGYRVASAEDGAEGIRKLQNESFDLVITDVVMPQVDGFQVMEYLKDYCPDVVVVAITAYVSTESAIEALRQGAYDYLSKPFDIDLMQCVIKRAIERARMQRAFRHYVGELERQVEEQTRKLVDIHTRVGKSSEELRVAQKELRRAEQSRSFGEVTSVAVQKLGDSLATIVGMAQIMGKTFPSEYRLRTQLERISEKAFHCHEIVKNLPDFSRKPALEQVPTNLNVLCEQLLAEIARQTTLANVDVVCEFDPQLPSILVDPRQLLQACTTIALHACYTVLNQCLRSRLIVKTIQAQDMIQLVFQVQGQQQGTSTQLGVPEAFSTAPDGGSEPELSLAYRTIQEHEGRVSIHTILEEGITYFIELPIRPLPTSWAEASWETSGLIGRKHVLIVDTDEKTLALLQEIAHHLGHESTGRTSAEQALQTVAADDYDLIITDLCFPTMGAIDFYHQLRTLRPRLAQRMLVISDGFVSDQMRALVEQVEGCLIKKPFSVSDIEAGMRQIWER